MIDKDVIEKLKEKHGDDLHLLSNDGVEFVFKRPPKEVYRRFRAKATRDEGSGAGDAAEGLVFACLVFPEAPALMVAIEKQYGLIDTFANKLVKLAGAAKECEAVPL
jgi:hypothetical protein